MIIDKAVSRLGGGHDRGELFELFVFEQVLKDYDLSYEELEGGWVDAPDDGGIDGFYILVDDHLVSEEFEKTQVRRNPHIVVFVVTAKSADSFRQPPLNSLVASLPELFDLRRGPDELKYPFPESLLDARE